MYANKQSQTLETIFLIQRHLHNIFVVMSISDFGITKYKPNVSSFTVCVVHQHLTTILGYAQSQDFDRIRILFVKYICRVLYRYIYNTIYGNIYNVCVLAVCVWFRIFSIRSAKIKVSPIVVQEKMNTDS